jgi:hypothetical protein
MFSYAKKPINKARINVEKGYGYIPKYCPGWGGGGRYKERYGTLEGTRKKGENVKV